MYHMQTFYSFKCNVCKCYIVGLSMVGGIPTLRVPPSNLASLLPIWDCQLVLGLVNLGPLRTRAKSRDLVMVRTLDSHPKAVPWVLGKPF